MKRNQVLAAPCVGIAVKALMILLFGNSILPTSASAAATGTACDPTTVVSTQMNWLKQNSYNYVTAVVASNRTHGLFQSYSQVTYAKIGLKQGTGWLLGWLVTSSPGKQFFDDRVWYGNNLDAHPFSPTATDSVSLNITPSGIVTISLGNGSQGFSTACLNGVLYGGPNPPSPGSLLTIGLTYPLYTITFEQGSTPPPPK